MHRLASLFLCFIVLYQCKAQTTASYNTDLFQAAYHFDAEKKLKETKLAIKAAKHNEAATDDQINNLLDQRDSLKDIEYTKIDHLLDRVDRSSHFELGTDITSKSYMAGRPSVVKGPIIAPGLAFYHRVGPYVYLSTQQYTDSRFKSVPIPEVDFGFGFQRELVRNWNVDISYGHAFLNYGGNLTRKLLSNNFSIATSYNFFDYITVGIYYDALFGGTKRTPVAEKHANQLGFGIEHDFYLYHFIGARRFTITPSALINLGSDNFLYLRNRGVTEQASGRPDLSTIQQTFWGLLDVEAAVNFDYRIKNLDIYASPIFAMPFNVPNATNPTVRDNTGKPVVYASFGIKYLFRAWKGKWKPKD
jgi:hypothetical protein